MRGRGGREASVVINAPLPLPPRHLLEVFCSMTLIFALVFCVDPTPPPRCENMDLPGSKCGEGESISLSQGVTARRFVLLTDTV